MSNYLKILYKKKLYIYFGKETLLLFHFIFHDLFIFLLLFTAQIVSNYMIFIIESIY